MTAGRQRLARWGEAKAEAWYVERGWEVLDRNWRCAGGEIDLVVARHGTVVFCEVKTRSTNAYGSGFEAVDRRKQQRLRRLAVAWLRAHPHNVPHVRFDVVSVQQGRVEVRERAF